MPLGCQRPAPPPFRALFWSLFERVGAQGVQLLVAIVLARILSPKEFGLVAMVTIFIAAGSLLTDSGFGMALLRLPRLTPEQCASVFYFNLGVSVCCAALLCAASGAIAAFFRVPELRLVVCGLSLGLIFNSLGLVQSVLLNRALDFGAQARATLPAALASGGVAILLARMGWGVWALVAQSVLSALLRSILLWWVSPWRPVARFSFAAVRDLFGFSSKLLASGGLETAFSQAYPLVIGRLYAAPQLGLYNLAQQFSQIPLGLVTNVYSRVNFPLMAAAQEVTEHLVPVFRQGLLFLSAVSVLMMTWMFVTAEDLVVVVLGDQWRASAPFLRLFCLLGALLPIHAMNLSLLKVKGRSDLFLRLEVIKKLFALLALGLTWPFGVTGLLWGQLVVSMLALWLNTKYSGRLVGYGFVPQARDLGGTFAAGLLALAVGAGTRHMLVGPPWLTLLVTSALTLTAFVGVLFVSNRETFRACYDTLRIGKLFRWTRRMGVPAA